MGAPEGDVLLEELVRLRADTNYEDADNDLKTTVLIGGAGEGTDRKRLPSAHHRQRLLLSKRN
ncbi:siphovirus ReqiPepy6 Gp37-like family protein [Lysinibacillus sphaericus]|uniref:siphovirus ReqiPepy6 Gp37-like family protein n=1 Tax=Lysinibacillus sphaericus TaxID=1421 RepID=UPI001C5D2AFC